MTITELVRRLSAEGASGTIIAIAVEAVEAANAVNEARKEKDRRRKASAYAASHGGSKEYPGNSVDTPWKLQGVSEENARAISSSLSTFLLVDQPLKQDSKEVRSELVALDVHDVSRVISDDWPADYESQFWAAYPRKIGRKAARAKLRTIRARREVTFAALMAGVKKIPIGEAKFIPHPTTWLNQGRWEDDHSTQGSQNGTSGNVVDASRRLSERISAFTGGSRLRVEAGNADVRLLPQGGGERPGDVHGSGDADTGGLPHGGDRASH